MPNLRMVNTVEHSQAESTKWKNEAKWLEIPFVEEQVLEAIKMCGNNKSPSPDGITLTFIKESFGVGFILEVKRISGGCNASFTTLIPKNDNPIGLNDYRPISLIGEFYKILSKVFGGKDEKGETQTTFIKGRHILDGVLVVNKTVEFIRGSKKKGLVFEKAYDNVDSKFLTETLSTMGFGSKWCNWVKTSLESVNTSVLVTGSPTKEFYHG
ncbi:hypothetical protein OSB04_008005 [Centaurea solstitialis]|uniref:Uncharacterized protein n=1 Tax=Centaurea solstitialis TaxID=347529 RepID=A0AA38TKX9_9ASTR|nr:hypothetical protein OSB04_008005 [Centaurea solstitialis]